DRAIELYEHDQIFGRNALGHDDRRRDVRIVAEVVRITRRPDAAQSRLIVKVAVISGVGNTNAAPEGRNRGWRGTEGLRARANVRGARAPCIGLIRARIVKLIVSDEYEIGDTDVVHEMRRRARGYPIADFGEARPRLVRPNRIAEFAVI